MIAQPPVSEPPLYCRHVSWTGKQSGKQRDGVFHRNAAILYLRVCDIPSAASCVRADWSSCGGRSLQGIFFNHPVLWPSECADVALPTVMQLKRRL
jgi:hypothetical protein